MHKSLIILFLTAATIIGCSADQSSDKKNGQTINQTEETSQSKQDKSGIAGTYWKLVSLQGEQVPVHEDQREAHIILKSEGQKVTGSGGCNVLNGTYELENDNSISFSKMATTMMSCPDMETEQQFLKVFERTNTYRVKGDTLLLNDGNEKTLARLVSVSVKTN